MPTMSEVRQILGDITRRYIQSRIAEEPRTKEALKTNLSRIRNATDTLRRLESLDDKEIAEHKSLLVSHQAYELLLEASRTNLQILHDLKIFELLDEYFSRIDPAINSDELEGDASELEILKVLGSADAQKDLRSSIERFRSEQNTEQPAGGKLLADLVQVQGTLARVESEIRLMKQGKKPSLRRTIGKWMKGGGKIGRGLGLTAFDLLVGSGETVVLGVPLNSASTVVIPSIIGGAGLTAEGVGELLA